MTPQERNKILEVISNEIRANGPIKLICLSAILEPQGFHRSLWAGKGLKRWLADNFPEFEISGPAGRDVLSLRIPKGENDPL